MFDLLLKDLNPTAGVILSNSCSLHRLHKFIFMNHLTLSVAEQRERNLQDF